MKTHKIKSPEDFIIITIQIGDYGVEGVFTELKNHKKDVLKFIYESYATILKLREE